MRSKLIIIADSLAMPRAGVKYEDTWVYLLKEQLYDIDIIEKLKRASTSERFVTEGGGIEFSLGSDLLEFYNPQNVIIQVGVTDCAPRLFHNKSFFSKFINNIPLRISSLIIQFLKNTRGRKADNAYVTPNNFKRNYQNYIERAIGLSVENIYAIEIGNISNELALKSPQFQKQINDYNKILRELAAEYKIFKIIPFGISSNDIDKSTVDGYHLNKEGNKQLFQSIKKELNILNE